MKRTRNPSEREITPRRVLFSNELERMGHTVLGQYSIIVISSIKDKYYYQLFFL